MLVEIHVLQNHVPSNLNRDDTGSPKDAVFGGVRRARISSQALKRAIRRSPFFTQAFPNNLAWRTRQLPDLVRTALLQRGLSDELANIGAQKASGFGNKDGKEQTPALTAQTMFVTEADVEALANVLYAAAKGTEPAAFAKVSPADLQKTSSLRSWRPITPDIALFGRMITSAAFRDVEAAAHVAHALSTHKMDQEFDYFTAVDDLKTAAEADDDPGADMIGDVEFVSACYYKYFSIDLDTLIHNLTSPSWEQTSDQSRQAHDIARTAILAFLKAAVFSTPSGKQASFAAHQLPDAILVEVRPEPTPVSYANAFVDPVSVGQRGLVTASIQRLIDHASHITQKFSLQSTARLWFTTGTASLPASTSCDTLDDLVGQLGKALEEQIHG